jgi:hypothetical protein
MGPLVRTKKESINYVIPTGRTNRGPITKALMLSRYTRLRADICPSVTTRLGSRLAGPDWVHLRSFPTAIFSCDACLDAIADRRGDPARLPFLHQLRLGDRTMPTHKFKIGETVFLKPSLNGNLPEGAYIVTGRLPKHNGEFKYRVRCSCQPHERFRSGSGRAAVWCH